VPLLAKFSLIDNFKNISFCGAPAGNPPNGVEAGSSAARNLHGQTHAIVLSALRASACVV
jgi:hypothetical protein